MKTGLLDLSDDTLLTVVQHLEVEEILSVRQTCRVLNDLTRYRSVWLHACNHFVKEQGLPFPYKHLDVVDGPELERLTRRALRLKNAWIRKGRQPCRTLSFLGGPLNGLHSVRFVFKCAHEFIITISEGIWPVIACWDLQHVENDAPTRVGEWFCKGATIKDVAVDSSLASDACIAVSIYNYSQSTRCLEIQRIKSIPGMHEVVFETIKTLDTEYSPVLLDGDILVVSDEYSETRVMNWKTGEYAILKGNEDADIIDFKHNKCLQVLFAHRSIFVARFRSIELFPHVDLCSSDEIMQPVYPLKICTFGWIDGVSMAPLSSFLPEYSYPPIAILVRAEQGDPWASHIHSVKYYVVSPDPAFDPTVEPSAGSTCPYIFPPVYLTSINAKRDFMRCPTLTLGPAGTSVWMGGVNSGQTQELWSMIWPGSIRNMTQPGHLLFSKLLKTGGSGGEIWTSMDYIESRGCIALGAIDGSVTVLYMIE